jgi:hypothetical protein
MRGEHISIIEVELHRLDKEPFNCILFPDLRQTGILSACAA